MSSTRILLAEDNTDHSNLLLRALARGRPAVDVLIASSKNEVMTAAREGAFDCIVMDYNLPPHTAPDIIRDLRAILPDIPIVIISSSIDQHVAINSFRTNGVADFVPKETAIENSVLWSRIESAIEDARGKRDERREADRRLKAAQRMAETDALTGLFNRRYADRILASERIRNDRRGQISFVMADIDHFKAINDEHGHDAGDRVLRWIAQLLTEKAGGGDVAVRWGGEEFLVLKPSASLTEAWAWTDALREHIAQTPAEIDGQLLQITASFGVATVPTRQIGENAVSLADQALYLAKEYGRNRVCTWPMAVAMEHAEDVQGIPHLKPDARLEEFLHRFHDSLGPNQLEHVGPHGVAVSKVAEKIGRSLRLPADEIADLCLAARYHDIGKIGVPERVIAKPGPLTREEKKFVDEHARFGANLLKTLGMNDRVVEMVAHHHDRYEHNDPGPLTNVVIVADAIVAMMSPRPYAQPRTLRQALAEIRHERGRQFDPDTVDTAHFLNLESGEAA